MHGQRPLALLAATALSVGAIDVGTGGAALPHSGSTCPSGQRRVADDICAAGSTALQVVEIVRDFKDRHALHAVLFGVWDHGTPLVSGATGTAYPGVAATRDMHVRIGNTTETFTTTLLLQLVDDGKLKLDDPISKWYPELPRADVITVRMLASSTSGYADYVKVESFLDAFHADPYVRWTPDELIAFGTSQPLEFEPGTSWAFSETNFVLLGEILRKVGGRPVAAQLRSRILRPLRLRETRMTTTAATPPPVLHGYSEERGPWEDVTFWSPSWATYTGNMTSTVDDMGRWATALGKGTLLSKSSHEAQITRDHIGKGPLTEDYFYGMGARSSRGWVFAAPTLLGITGIVASQPEEGLSVVMFATASEESPPGTHSAAAIFNAVGQLLAPDHAPASPTARS